MRQAKLAFSKEELCSRLKSAIQRLQNDEPRPRAIQRLQEQVTDYRARCRQIAGKLRANAERQVKLRAEIAHLETAIEPLESRLCHAVRKESRLQLLRDGDYRWLDTRKKSMMDALRVTAANMFRNVQEQFRAIDDNFRDDHVLVRMLSRCTGSLTKTVHATTVKLWLPGTLQPHRIQTLKALLETIAEQTNRQMFADRSLRLSLVTGPIKV